MAEIKKLDTNVSNNNATEGEQPSYEELKDYCNQLLMQRNQLRSKLLQVTNVLNKLPWLFEVLKAKELFKKDFVDKCVLEIEEIMTPPKEEQESNEE
jgi:hypothetical protein